MSSSRAGRECLQCLLTQWCQVNSSKPLLQFLGNKLISRGQVCFHVPSQMHPPNFFHHHVLDWDTPLLSWAVPRVQETSLPGSALVLCDCQSPLSEMYLWSCCCLVCKIHKSLVCLCPRREHCSKFQFRLNCGFGCPRC